MLLGALDNIFFLALRKYIDKEKGKPFIDRLLNEHGILESEVSNFFEYLNNLWDRGYSNTQLSEEIGATADEVLFLLRHRKLTDNIKRQLSAFSIGKNTYRKLLKCFHLEYSNPDTLIDRLRHVWHETKRISAFSKQLGVSSPTGIKIIEFIDPEYFAVCRSRATNKTPTEKPVFEERLLAFFKLSNNDHNNLYKKVYKLWHKEGTFYGLANRLRISHVSARSLIRHIEVNEIIEGFHKPARKLTLAKRNQILEVYGLFNRLGTLEAVGKEKGLTRERIRQILEKGNEYGIVDYKASVIRKFDELANNISKAELEHLIVEQGSVSKTIMFLKNTYRDAATDKRINGLIELYNINLRELSAETQRRQCLADYNRMVQVLGHHPSTTELSKRADGLLLWRRIYRLWGKFNAFRKEFGIIVPRKPSSAFSNGLKESWEESKKRKQERKQRVFEIILQKGPISVRDIAGNIDVGATTLSIYLREMREENMVKWSHIGNRSLYSAMTPK